jgi:hypothetical protein
MEWLKLQDKKCGVKITVSDLPDEFHKNLSFGSKVIRGRHTQTAW